MMSSIDTAHLIQIDSQPALIGMPKREIVTVVKKAVYFINEVGNVGMIYMSQLNTISPFKEGQEKTFDCVELLCTDGNDENMQMMGYKVPACENCKGTGEITYRVTGDQELKQIKELPDESVPPLEWYWKASDKSKSLDFYIVLAHVEMVKKNHRRQ